jgi:lipopolysaccharide export system protein LptA
VFVCLLAAASSGWAQSPPPIASPDSAHASSDSAAAWSDSAAASSNSADAAVDSAGAGRAATGSVGEERSRTDAVDPAPSPSGPVEPWFLEGESLDGTSYGGTEIRSPHITHRSLDITARAGRLSPDRDILTLRDSVVIADSSRTIRGREGIYRRALRILDLAGDVQGEGPEGSFRCGDLTWDRLNGRMVLRDGPVVSEPDRVLQARRIEYETGARHGTAFGDVRVLLLPDSVRAYGERSEYDEGTGRSVLTGEPRLVIPGGSGEPGMTVHADTLVLRESDRSGEAIGRVRIVRGDLRTVSRRAEFRLQQNQILLTGEPVSWDLDGDIRADTMSVRVRERKADQLRAWGAVRVRYEPRDKAGERNLVLGDTLTAGLSGGALNGMEIFGRAQSLYLPGIRDVLTGSGRNLSRARSIRVVLREGQAQRVDLIGKASGTYIYPGDASRRRLDEPAVLDSVVPAWARSSSPARGSEEEPPALAEFLAKFLKEHTLAFPDSAGAFDRLFDERVEYEGDTIRFFVPEDRIRLQGAGVLRYRESTLKSNRIDYDAKRRLVTAVGEPELSDGQSTVTGVKMTYRTDERQGIVYRGRTELDGAFYRGREVKKMPDDELLVKSGDYTTCEEDSAPHYHFHSSRMKLLQKDKAVARPVILYIKRIPVLALPYYIFPLRKGRHSGIMMPDMELGFNRNAGRFARNMGYYWAISDYMDARAWCDFYERGPRYYLNGVYQYKVRYLLDGKVDGSWLREKSTSGGRSKGWSLQSSHSQRLGNNASAMMSTNFTSSQSYRGDRNFGTGIDERLNRKLKSSLELRKGWSRTSLSAGASRTEYLDETTGSGVKLQVDGPYADVILNTGALGRAPDAAGRGGHLAALSTVSYGTSFRYRTTYERRFDGRVSARRAFQQNVSLSDNRRLGSYLRLSPSLTANWAVFGRDNQGRHNQAAAAWSFGASAGNTLYGTFLFPVGPLAGLRHIVEPSVNWGYSPELRQLTYRDPADTTGHRRLARFPSVSGIGLSGSKRSALSLSVNQRVHARWKLGSRVIKQENLLTLSSSSSYDFLAKPVPGKVPTRRFTSLSNNLRFRPWSRFETSASVSHDPYGWAPISFNVRTDATLAGSAFAGGRDTTGAGGQTYGEFGSVSHQGPSGGTKQPESAPASAGASWSTQISHSYSTSRGAPKPVRSLTLNLTLSLHPTPKWKCDGSVYADARTRKVISHSFSLYRDLHCWDLRFEHRTVGSRAEYLFHIAIRQLPDVKYDRESR